MPLKGLLRSQGTTASRQNQTQERAQAFSASRMHTAHCFFSNWSHDFPSGVHQHGTRQQSHGTRQQSRRYRFLSEVLIQQVLQLLDVILQLFELFLLLHRNRTKHNKTGQRSCEFLNFARYEQNLCLWTLSDGSDFVSELCFQDNHLIDDPHLLLKEN